MAAYLFGDAIAELGYYDMPIVFLGLTMAAIAAFATFHFIVSDRAVQRSQPGR